MSTRLPGYAAISLFLVTLLGALHHDARGQGLKAGDEVLAMDPNLVLELSYRTPSLRVFAYRWEVGDKFKVFAAHKDGRRQTTCIGGGNFRFILEQFKSLKLRREIDAATAAAFLRAKSGKEWAELVIRDSIELEPFQALIAPLEGSTNEALIRIGSSTYAVAIDHRTFALMSRGCATLTAGNVRSP
jgi:hypothetical protein